MTPALSSYDIAQNHVETITRALAQDREAVEQVSEQCEPLIHNINVQLAHLYSERERLLRQKTCAERTVANYSLGLNFFTKLLPSTRRVLEELETQLDACFVALTNWEIAYEPIMLSLNIEREQLIRRKNSGLGPDRTAQLEKELDYWQTRVLDFERELFVQPELGTVAI